MNEENINKSFNDLFEHDGWLITKNEKGKVKVASCEQDESNLYEKTREWKVKEVDDTKTDTFKLPPSEINKIGRFFVRDLLNSEREDDHFVCYGIPYKNVFVCGTVVSLFEKNDKYSVVVDDGTSCIKCMIEKETLDSARGDCSIRNDELNQLFRGNEKNVLVQAAVITTRCTEFIQNQVPKFQELSLGDIVRVFGALGEYNCNRYVFIRKIVKEPKETDSHVTYLEDMLHLYSELYKI